MRKAHKSMITIWCGQCYNWNKYRMMTEQKEKAENPFGDAEPRRERENDHSNWP